MEKKSKTKVTTKEIIDITPEQNPLAATDDGYNPLQVPAPLKKLLDAKTPDQFIETREGPGGMNLDYVEVGYMRRRIESIFGMYWSEETTELTSVVEAMRLGHAVTKTIITVKIPLFKDGELTGDFFPTSRVGYGGKDIAFLKDKPDTPVDIGNDFKSARADSFKKAVAQFGIAADVYEPNIQQKKDQAEALRKAKEVLAKKDKEKPAENFPKDPDVDYINQATAKAITKSWRNAGLADSDVQNYMKVKFKGVSSLLKLTQNQADTLIAWICEAKKK